MIDPTVFGTVYKIYKTQPFRAAFIEVINDEVSATTPALSFMIGWPYEKVISRTTEFGYTLITSTRTRGYSWITRNPHNIKVI